MNEFHFVARGALLFVTVFLKIKKNHLFKTENVKVIYLFQGYKLYAIIVLFDVLSEFLAIWIRSYIPDRNFKVFRFL